jgi:hypothetical protein
VPSSPFAATCPFHPEFLYVVQTSGNPYNLLRCSYSIDVSPVQRSFGGGHRDGAAFGMAPAMQLGIQDIKAHETFSKTH